MTMKRPLSAFISYRHDDAFAPSSAFVEKVKSALNKAGFETVFEDFGSIQPGEDFEDRIYRGIANCDLFVPLIGAKWLAILQEKVTRREKDILSREVRDAIRLDKEIIPVLVDGAEMPSQKDLPDAIRALHTKNGVQIASNNSVHQIARKFKPAAAQIAQIRKLGSRWCWGYSTAAIVTWLLGAVLTNAVGWWEFGREPWLGMAQVWSGFFIFPIFVLPFTLIALYRPLTVLIEATINAASLGDSLTYFAPVLAGGVFAALGVIVEATPPEAPWTIHPILSGCEGEGQPVLGDLDALKYYDTSRTLQDQPRFKDRFWLKNMCWPDAFFYLVVPPQLNASNGIYETDRQPVQQTFLKVIDWGSPAPYSKTFFAHVPSLLALFFPLAVGIVMAIFYVTVKIRSPYNTELRIPVEDSYFCLTYAFVTMMIWIPFRMNTTYVKHIYFGCDNTNPCAPGLLDYSKDLILFIMLLLAYVYLTAGLFYKYRRWVMGFLGAAAVVLIISIAIAVVWFNQRIAPLTEQWPFYVGISIVVITMLLALWLQFDPAIVRLKDFKKGD
jgi:hypothetical protein